MLMTAAEAAAGSTASASSAIRSGLSTADSLDTARSSRVPRRMRFFEFESRRIVAKGDIPVSGHGYATTPADARRIAESLGGPTVIKSQVLTGGRMKAGGVRFADSPEEAERHAADILALEINGHTPPGPPRGRELTGPVRAGVSAAPGRGPPRAPGGGPRGPPPGRRRPLLRRR